MKCFAPKIINLCFLRDFGITYLVYVFAIFLIVYLSSQKYFAHKIPNNIIFFNLEIMFAEQYFFQIVK